MRVPVALLIRLEALDRGDVPAASDLESAMLEVLDLRKAPDEAWQLGLAAVFLEWSRDRWRDRRIGPGTMAERSTTDAGGFATPAPHGQAQIEEAERHEAHADDRLRALHWAFGHSLGHLDITLGDAARHVVVRAASDDGADREAGRVEQWRRTPLTALDA